MLEVDEVKAQVLRALRSGDVDRADELSRRAAERAWKYEVSGWDERRVLRFVDEVTGGLGYRKERPLDIIDMVMAGTYIAWPEAVRDHSRVLEVGTGLGRTCYVVHKHSHPETYLTIDNSVEILALALFSDLAPPFRETLWRDSVKVVLADAVHAVAALRNTLLLFEHLIHDGGPNPLRNPRLYTADFMRMLGSVLRCGATASVFAGKARRARTLVFEALKSAGFDVIDTVTLPESTALVFRALWSCRSALQRR